MPRCPMMTAYITKNKVMSKFGLSFGQQSIELLLLLLLVLVLQVMMT